jgi:CHAD domain-containing protein
MAKAKIRGLDCAAPAEKMIPVILRAQVKAMCALREKALNWKDPEGVHDMRVLSRRLRSTINDFRPYFRKGSLPRPKLRILAKKLGDVRDEDVALIALKQLASKAKDAAAEGIELIAEERKARRAQARTDLKDALVESLIDEFRKSFLSKLRGIAVAFPTPTRRQQTAEGDLSFHAFGVQVIKERLKDFTAASRCLYLPYEVKDLHELRILSKRLRYSLELFSNCLGEDSAKTAKEVANMQTSLGELHDCDVWIEHLGLRLKHTARRAAADPNELKVRAGAMWLLRHFSVTRMEHYRNALAQWEQWQSDAFLEQLVLTLDRDLSPPKTNVAQPA